MKSLLIMLLLSSCVATSGDLREIANSIDDGASVSSALRATADGIDARPGAMMGLLNAAGPAGTSLGAIIVSVLGIVANDRRRNRNRVKRGEPVGTTPVVPPPAPKEDFA